MCQAEGTACANLRRSCHVLTEKKAEEGRIAGGRIGAGGGGSLQPWGDWRSGAPFQRTGRKAVTASSCSQLSPSTG